MASKEIEYIKTRKELADKYFQGISQYAQGNLGLVTILSDIQQIFQQIYPPPDKSDCVYWDTILSEIKSILIEDDKIKRN